MTHRSTMGLVLFLAVVVAPLSAQSDAPDAVFEARQRRAEEAPWLRTGYLIFGLATPSGGYAATPGADDVHKIFTNPEQMNGIYDEAAAVDVGYFAELGGSRYFRVAGLPPTVRFGLGWALSGTYAEVMWNELYSNEPAEQIGDWSADFRIGPTLAAALTNQVIVDVGLKVGYAVGERGWADINTAIQDGNVSVLDENSSVGSGIAWSGGANIKFSWLFAGFAVHNASLSHTRHYTVDGAISRDFEYVADINQRTLRIFVGFGT